MSFFQQTEMWFNLLLMHRVDCEGSVVLDKFRLFIKRVKISRNAQNWCQTIWILVRFWWKKTLSEETFNVTSFPRFLVFVILSLNNAKFCLWFHLIKIKKFLGSEVKMHGLKIYICDSNVPMEGLIASFFRFCRRQDNDSKFWMLSDASISRSFWICFSTFFKASMSTHCAQMRTFCTQKHAKRFHQRNLICRSSGIPSFKKTWKANFGT